MSTFRDGFTPAYYVPTSTREAMSALVQELGKHWASSPDIWGFHRDFEKKHTQHVMMNFFMTDDIMSLGCDIVDRNGIDRREWVHWMSCTEITYKGDETEISFRNNFLMEGADKRLARHIASHLKTSLYFLIDENLKRKVDPSIPELPKGQNTRHSRKRVGFTKERAQNRTEMTNELGELSKRLNGSQKEKPPLESKEKGQEIDSGYMPPATDYKPEFDISDCPF